MPDNPRTPAKLVSREKSVLVFWIPLPLPKVRHAPTELHLHHYPTARSIDAVTPEWMSLAEIVKTKTARYDAGRCEGSRRFSYDRVARVA